VIAIATVAVAAVPVPPLPTTLLDMRVLVLQLN
jgi:hypothetical protein